MCCFNDIRNATTQESLFSKLVYVNAWGWGRLNLCLSAACEMKTNSLGGSRMRSLFSRCRESRRESDPNKSLCPPKVSRCCCNLCAVISASEDGYFSSEKIFNLDFWGEQYVILTVNPTPELKDLTQRKGQKIVRTFQTEKKERLVVWMESGCFPCLLFLAGSDKVWVKEGYCDPNNMPRALLKHEKSTNLQIK